eukprot:CAMPEP_0195300420 /NCGR_PEP_ID=MMETSP0707-20130614/27377_1 /TAXON_ID=33640 /ORGANISM="Asterionellopsis glacialis, Strain CCMP134" /LENGTH=264 /DNA_ID=CAMNT_0040363099 /DNA_START=30 /DNA_END=825 /DNA_ORIENTATION=-
MSSKATAVVSKLGTLRVHGRDSKGIVAAVSKLLDQHGCDIIKSEQWTDRVENLFFQRIQFDYQHLTTDRDAAEHHMNDLCRNFGIRANLNWRQRQKRVAIMVSKSDHCLWELLLRHRAHELDCEIPVVLSNHPNLQPVADTFGIPYEVVPITPETKLQQEEKELNLLQNEYKVDCVVLARYMQVLSETFLHAYHNNVINIHHSFLPAFMGSRAYHQANQRGVKLIGATAHYATLDLDEGPIIDQDVIEVSHRDDEKILSEKAEL